MCLAAWQRWNPRGSWGSPGRPVGPALGPWLASPSWERPGGRSGVWARARVWDVAGAPPQGRSRSGNQDRREGRGAGLDTEHVSQRSAS